MHTIMVSMTDDAERRLNRLEGQCESLDVFRPQFLRAMREDNQAFRQEVRVDFQTMEAKMETKADASRREAHLIGLGLVGLIIALFTLTASMIALIAN
jgi:uncharacterized membrane protein